MTSRAVSPRVGKVSEEVEGGDSDVNECSSESNEEEQHALQGRGSVENRVFTF